MITNLINKLYYFYNNMELIYTNIDKYNINTTQYYLYKSNKGIVTEKDLRLIIENIILDLENQNFFNFKAKVNIIQLNDTNNDYNNLCKSFIIDNNCTIFDTYENINWNTITKNKLILVIINFNFTPLRKTTATELFSCLVY